MATHEGKVKAQVKRWLDARSIWHFSPVSNGMGRHGIPDIICCWEGRFLAIETKAPGRLAYVSALQEREINSIRLAKGLAIVVDDVKLLDELLGDLK